MEHITLETIDLTNFDIDNDDFLVETAAKLKKIFTEGFGFFYLKFSSDPSATAAIIEATKRFFDLSLEKKMMLKNDASTQLKINGMRIEGTGGGYRGQGEDPNFSKDNRESYNVFADEIVGEDTGTGANKYPEEDDLPGWREVVSGYTGDILRLANKLRTLIAVALDLDKHYFDKPGYFDKSTWALGFVHYFQKESDVESGYFGIRPHTDAGIFTLLATDGQPGLQVCLDGDDVPAVDKTWHSVASPPPGHLIVNLGKNMQVWSGGRFRATLHRVVMDGSRERFSVPFFYESNLDLVIKPLVGQAATREDTNLDGQASRQQDKGMEITPAVLLLNRLTSNKSEDFR